MSLTSIFQTGLEKAYAVFGESAAFTPAVGSPVDPLTVIIDYANDWQPGGEVLFAQEQIVISYMRKDIDRRVKVGEVFTIGESTYTVRSMAPYPDSWNQFEGKCVVVKS
jgi:hypothetical protein